MAFRLLFYGHSSLHISSVLSLSSPPVFDGSHLSCDGLGFQLLPRSPTSERGLTSHRNRFSVLDLLQVMAVGSIAFDCIVFPFGSLTHPSADGSGLVIIDSVMTIMFRFRDSSSQKLVKIARRKDHRWLATPEASQEDLGIRDNGVNIYFSWSTLTIENGHLFSRILEMASGTRREHRSTEAS
ncbi:hypothetical protein F2Q68_00021692 [Brassica cretica]|uniref:Uncharacterized protein n=2 Tax=Brassica cretica TaxID=69181 RepID=A0ABQ7CRM3_BRACR|nr:hypothetical protein F2Q68_00021692 [Brassica cretica]KAF3562692.1 hypothetical protein DY000_02017115 [Brassica cretica]